MIQEIISCVVNANAASFAGIVTKTEVKVPKKLGFADVVTCVTDKVVQVKYSYESAVNRHRKAEGKTPDFKAEALPWGQWLIPNLIIVHNDKHYLRVYDLHTHNVRKTYYVGDRVATEAEVAIIKAWQSGKSKSTRQGVAKEVLVSNVCFDNILRLTCDGQAYIKG